MPEDEVSANQFDPAANDGLAEHSRNGAEKRRDPNQPGAVVGLGASAGGVAVLQQFFADMDPQSGMAFVVVMHLSPDFESQLASVLQQKTSMPVVQVNEAVKVRPNHVYVIPPNHQLTFEDSALRLIAPQKKIGRRVTIDLFFRTLAQAYGQRAVCVILSGTDSDGVIGLKHIRAQGGVTMAQEPSEAEFESMPRMAIETGMVDWVLPVAQMPTKLMEFVQNENAMQLSPEILGADDVDLKEKDAPGGETVSDETRDPNHEAALTEIMVHLRERTGHDFSHYKRATVLRRIARRLQVNSLETLPEYVAFLHSHSNEARALLQDLLIGVTHFFRDQDAFASLEANIPQLFAGKPKDEQVRVWVAGCATGEEAYSIAILLSEYAEQLQSLPPAQIFATDLDEEAIRDAREGIYPATIEADVSAERLKRFFLKDQGRYRVNKEIRETVLFAPHDLLRDAPFSRLDLISCRNLLIYLNRPAQEEAFDVFHFALRAGGLLFIGGSETEGSAQGLFSPVDAKHRVYVRRSVPRPSWKVPLLPARAPLPRPPMLPAMTAEKVESAGDERRATVYEGQERRSILFGELHLKLLENYGPPSVLINESYDIVHLSEKAGRYLQFAAGEPSANLLDVIHPSLRVELRTALYRAEQMQENVIVSNQMVDLNGAAEMMDLHIRPIRPEDSAHGFFLVLFETKTEPLSPGQMRTRHESVNRDLDEELHKLKRELNATVEQYEASNEELKASNEELQAMNEEMRSAAEELETSKEELQSVNEELTTVNHELKEKLEELSLTNSDLQNLMSATDVGTIFLDRQLRIKRFTPRVQELFNLLSSDSGRPISDITHKLSYEALVSDAQRVLDKLAPVEREVRAEDGRVYLARIAPYRSLEDRISGVVITFVDVTEPRRAEEGARQTAEHFQRALEDAPVPVIMYAEDGAVLQVSQCWKEVTGYGIEDMPTFDAWLDRVYSDGAQPIRARLHDLFEGKRRIEGIEFPVRTRQGDVRHWNFSASTPGTLRDGRRFIVAMALDITDRMKAEAALREGERFVRSTLDSFSSMIAIIDPQGVILDVNESWKDFARENNYRSSTFGIGENYLEVTQRAAEKGEFDAKRIGEGIGAVLGGKLASFEFEYPCHPPEGFRWFMVSVSPLATMAGGAVIWHTDITERKRAEEALRESDEQLRAALTAADMGTWQANLTTGQGTRDANLNRILGHEAVETTQAIDDCFRLIHPEDKPAAQAAWEKAIASKGIYETEFRLQREDGSERWLREQGRYVAGEDGEPDFIVGLTIDFTERRRAEEALRESEERFRQFAENSADVFWILDARTQQLEYINPVYEKMFGQAREEVMRNRKARLKLVHPDDREEAAAGLPRATTGESFVRNYRIIRPSDGETRWIRDTGFPIYDEDGKVVRIAGVAQDVTEDKNRTDQLSSSEQRFRLLVEGAPDYAMFLLDSNNEITYWSSGAEKVFGWSAMEAIGKSGNLIFTPEDKKKGAVEKEIGLARKQGYAPDQRWHLRNDGSRIWVDGVMRRIDNADGSLRGFAKIARDATERRQFEDALQHARDELEQRVLERTRDLLATNTELERTMAQRQQLEKELLEISEREKRRIGQDLHDIVCQELSASALFLKSSANRAEKKDPQVAKQLNEAAEIVNRNVTLARNLARGFQPVKLSGGEFTAAMRSLVSETNSHRSLYCRLDMPRPIELPNETTALNVYRIAQEALTNVVKHADAETVVVSLRRRRGHLHLTIEDDGKGFRVKKKSKGLGLHIMDYRASVLGGTFSIETNSSGTKILCTIPLKSRP